jgi:hypothetical protein
MRSGLGQLFIFMSLMTSGLFVRIFGLIFGVGLVCALDYCTPPKLAIPHYCVDLK